jgi:hypothetical protein
LRKLNKNWGVLDIGENSDFFLCSLYCHWSSCMCFRLQVFLVDCSLVPHEIWEKAENLLVFWIFDKTQKIYLYLPLFFIYCHYSSGKCFRSSLYILCLHPSYEVSFFRKFVYIQLVVCVFIFLCWLLSLHCDWSDLCAMQFVKPCTLYSYILHMKFNCSEKMEPLI